MRVLVLHNRYRQRGGEDLVVQSEVRLLRDHGVEVVYFEADNPAPEGVGVSEKVRLALASSWSAESYTGIRELCEQYRPDVAHVHNFWMKLSPSVHAACRASGAATVQTLHNFRLLCVNALFLRNGRLCEDCLGKAPWRGVVRRCYRGSLFPSAAVAGMIFSNRKWGTWERDVDALIALSESSRSRFAAGGLPANRIFVKPNFVEEPFRTPCPPSASDVVLYAGRLSPEKGLSELLLAWARARLGSYGRLLIVGDGPSREALQNQADSLGLHDPEVVFAGPKRSAEVRDSVATARAVVLPSICLENFPRNVVEAFACGRPVVAAKLGALSEIVQHGREGLKFEPGDAVALAGALRSILSDGSLVDHLGENARAAYLAKYTPERNFEILMGIYRFAIQRRGRAVPDSLRAFEPAEAGVPACPASASVPASGVVAPK